MKPIINHLWNLELDEAESLQRNLAKKISLKPAFKFSDLKTIAGCDVSYKNNKVSASLVIFKFPELTLIKQYKIVKEYKDIFEYVSGFLAFREGPIILELLENVDFEPDVIIFDGQGIAHPRGIGIASHIGVLFNISTIGCAKNFLFGKYIEPENYKGAKSYLFNFSNEIIGVVLRTKENVKPIFISPGNKINVELSFEIILNCCRNYRLPEPLRISHIFSKL